MMDKDEIANIIAANPIEEVIAQYVSLSRAGSGFKGLSCFQKEKTPSLMVHPGKQIFKDFSSGKGGDVVEFLMNVEGWDFITTLKNLAARANIDIGEKNDIELSGFGVVDAGNKQLQEIFLETPNYSFFEQRGISVETQKKFGIGYCGNDFIQRFQQKGIDKEILKRTGNGNWDERGGYCRFLERITIPIHNSHGLIIGFGGRDITGEKDAKYVNTAESPRFIKRETLYNMNRARAEISLNGEVWLVEGYTDVMFMDQSGYSNVVASMGTNFTETQAKELKKVTNTVNIAFDGDKAGFAAIMRAIPILINGELVINVWPLPSGKDPAEALKNGHKPQRQPFFEFWKEYEKTVSITQKYEAFSIIHKAIVGIQDIYLKSIYQKELQLILT